MQILFINNDGAGFADTIEIKDDTTIAQLFAEQLPNRKPADYFIRVNRLPNSVRSTVVAVVALVADDRATHTAIRQRLAIITTSLKQTLARSCDFVSTYTKSLCLAR